MPHCSKCGTAVAPQAAFCPNCGAPQSVEPAAAPIGVPMSPTETGLSENVAGLLCYVLGWVTGLIFLLIDKRPFVRFHAAQSLVTFGALHIISIILVMAFIGRFFRRLMVRVWILVGHPGNHQTSELDSLDCLHDQSISARALPRSDSCGACGSNRRKIATRAVNFSEGEPCAVAVREIRERCFPRNDPASRNSPYERRL